MISAQKKEDFGRSKIQRKKQNVYESVIQCLQVESPHYSLSLFAPGNLSPSSAVSSSLALSPSPAPSLSSSSTSPRLSPFSLAPSAFLLSLELKCIPLFFLYRFLQHCSITEVLDQDFGDLQFGCLFWLLSSQSAEETKAFRGVGQRLYHYPLSHCRQSILGCVCSTVFCFWLMRSKL
ncbi:hypothetical protein F7725_010235 [Dissostichus mawsoni]|uniref:Uncharacterized protein n=1 Tax=Dissostichus mawsoni TaxID=36200 RepID=A0A7J5XPG2_DISMA|nr:hypothetical protein F7725_010235 [Dissostichus mawsoni]